MYERLSALPFMLRTSPANVLFARFKKRRRSKRPATLWACFLSLVLRRPIDDTTETKWVTAGEKQTTSRRYHHQEPETKVTEVRK